MFSKLSIATLLGAATFAAGAAATPQAAKPAEEPPKEQVVCSVEHTLGSHLPKRTCMTQAARDERAKHDQEAMRNLHGNVAPLKADR